jgi:parallel beta-helix repeat protein
VFLSPTFAGQNVTIRPLNNTQIAGITITNPNTRGTAIWVESTNPVIQDNTFANSLRDGVFITGTGDPTVSNNRFFNNNGNGVSVVWTARGTIQNNVFQDTGFGIAVGDTSTPTIANNQIIENVDGVVVSDAARPVLRNNIIQNNTRDGIVAITEARPDMGTVTSPGGNVIRSNSRYDVHNATRNFTLVAVGNDIDASRMLGDVELIAAGPPSSFPDVQGHWAQPYIEAMAALDVIRGFPDGTYRPNDLVTRAQFAAIINKAFNPTPKRPVTQFSDIQAGFWGQQAIDVAYRGGFMTGLPGGVFRPDERIPKVQVLVSLASGLGLTTDDPTVLSRYQDASDIPTWATDAVAAATQNNIVINYPSVTQLGPFREATRAEVAALVYQALVQAGKAEAIESPYVVTP